MLKLAPKLELPDEIVTEALAIVANRGAGKTYTSKVLVELMTKAGLPSCIIDPLGVWWGLRSSADGTKAGLQFIVLGGSNGDLPLEPEAGKVIADFVLDQRVPVILDLSLMRKAAARRFVSAFLEEIYERNKLPLHLVVDECDLFCPQRPSKDFPMTLLGTMEDIVRRGRSKGLGITLISQRPAVIHKDVLSQVSVLIALRLVSPQDRNAIKDWIETQGTAEERNKILTELPKLATGEGFFYSPAFMGILTKFKAYPSTTFDSSATPKLGETRIEPTAFASVDLDALSSQMASTIQFARANDPKLLRQRVSVLERRLMAVQGNLEDPKVSVAQLQEEVAALREHASLLVDRPPTVEVHEVISEAQMTLMRGAVKIVEEAQAELADVSAVMTAVLDQAQEDWAASAAASDPLRVLARPGADLPPRPEIKIMTPPKSSSPSLPPTGDGGDDSLSKAERQVMSVLAQHPEGRTYNQIAILSGRSGKSSALKNALSSLRTSGALTGDNKTTMFATEAGLDRLGRWDPLPQGRALFDHWSSMLGKSEKVVLGVIVAAYPDSLSKDEISDRSGYSLTSSGFKNALSKLRTLELISGYDYMLASEIFFAHGDWR